MSNMYLPPQLQPVPDVKIPWGETSNVFSLSDESEKGTTRKSGGSNYIESTRVNLPLTSFALLCTHNNA